MEKEKKKRKKRKIKATLIRTRDNRGYVFNAELCIVCKIDDKDNISKYIRTGNKKEVLAVETLKNTGKMILLSRALRTYFPGNWEIYDRKEESITFVRKKRFVQINIAPSEAYPRTVLLTDIVGPPVYLPAGKTMPRRCTLEKYIEIVDTERVSDTNPHCDYKSLHIAQ